MCLSSPRCPRPYVTLAFWRKPNHDLVLLPFSSVISVSLQHWATISSKENRAGKRTFHTTKTGKLRDQPLRNGAQEKASSSEKAEDRHHTLHVLCVHHICKGDSSNTRKHGRANTILFTQRTLYQSFSLALSEASESHADILKDAAAKYPKELDSQNSLSPWSTRSLQWSSHLGCRRTAALLRRAGHKFQQDQQDPSIGWLQQAIDPHSELSSTCINPSSHAWKHSTTQYDRQEVLATG